MEETDEKDCGELKLTTVEPLENNTSSSHKVKLNPVSIMPLASTIFQEINFTKFAHLNALGSKFDLEVK